MDLQMEACLGAKGQEKGDYTLSYAKTDQHQLERSWTASKTFTYQMSAKKQSFLSVLGTKCLADYPIKFA